jgi:preprotein translocase subunit YajC
VHQAIVENTQTLHSHTAGVLTSEPLSCFRSPLPGAAYNSALCFSAFAPPAPAGFQQGNHVFISEAFAQAAPAAAAASESPFGNISTLLMFGVMFAVMWIFMIRPQAKRQKEQQAMIAGVAKGDEIVFAGGFLGKITKLGETYLTVEIANGVNVQVQRTAIIQVLPTGTVK